MENKIILADTSILIDYFRKTDKSKSKLVKLFDIGYDFCISAVTEHEIYSGTSLAQLEFWNTLLDNIKVIHFDHIAVQTAVNINKLLKSKRKQIGIADLFIAATAIANDLPIATLNKKHFEWIEILNLID